ncbi:hypothetical protein AAFF_G00087960 [Aldrovandia affinis]|uniref:Uncharacterized protein n=1 Tax=Aldrovandia affinis TaxID=143900 RepID=A0AAD7RWQ6_9TELE|nr:hypothetical protein AAFF_G00087960 [Aldrovandia affinis]
MNGGSPSQTAAFTVLIVCRPLRVFAARDASRARDGSCWQRTYDPRSAIVSASRPLCVETMWPICKREKSGGSEVGGLHNSAPQSPTALSERRRPLWKRHLLANARTDRIGRKKSGAVSFAGQHRAIFKTEQGALPETDSRKDQMRGKPKTTLACDGVIPPAGGAAHGMGQTGRSVTHEVTDRITREVTAGTAALSCRASAVRDQREAAGTRLT